jgi:hypothetical protein
MPAEARGKCLALLLLLIPAIAVHGTPSAPIFSTSAASTASSCSLDPEINLSSGLNSLCSSSYPNLAHIGKEIFNPPTEASTRSALPARVRSLPGVPAGIFMVLVGFLCVSFVNDRRIWLASLAGLLWLGQTGLAAIPQAASHIIKRNAAQNCPGNELAAGRADRNGRLRSEFEGTQYIALLRHLAGIPVTVIAKEPQATVAISTLASQKLSVFLRTTKSYLKTLGDIAVSAHPAQTSECAIAGAASIMTNLTIRSACAAEYSVRFSPAFVFSNLARGPPQFD